MTQSEVAAACNLSIPAMIRRAKELGLNTRALGSQHVDAIKAIPKHAQQRSRRTLRSEARKFGPESKHYVAMREIAVLAIGRSAGLDADQIDRVVRLYSEVAPR